LNTVDIVLAGLLIFAAFKGFRKGFVMEVISTLALIIAIFVGFKLLHEGMDLLRENFEISSNFLPYLSFVLLFVATILLMNFMGSALKKVIHMTLLGGVDRIAGGLFCVLKWTFGISVLIWIFNYFQLNPLENYVDNAVIYPFVVSVAPEVISFLVGILPLDADFFVNQEKLV
jgi:membrane protein required for colicin V production